MRRLVLGLVVGLVLGGTIAADAGPSLQEQVSAVRLRIQRVEHLMGELCSAAESPLRDDVLSIREWREFCRP